MASCRSASSTETPKAEGGGAFGSQKAPEAAETMGSKVKKEVIKALKLQLVLVPVLVVGLVWWNPPISKADEKKLQERYEKSAGWKT